MGSCDLSIVAISHPMVHKLHGYKWATTMVKRHSQGPLQCLWWDSTYTPHSFCEHCHSACGKIKLIKAWVLTFCFSCYPWFVIWFIEGQKSGQDMLKHENQKRSWSSLIDSQACAKHQSQTAQMHSNYRNQCLRNIRNIWVLDEYLPQIYKKNTKLPIAG